MQDKAARSISQKRDPGNLLLSQIAKLAGEDADAALIRERPWASITFSGTRHEIEICFPPDHDESEISELTELLPDHEFALPGYFVADLLVDIDPDRNAGPESKGQRLKVEALTIVDPVVDDQGAD